MFNDIIDSIINNASNEEIEIIREKLNNHLINHIYDSNIHEELSNNYDSSFLSSNFTILKKVSVFSKDKL